MDRTTWKTIGTAAAASQLALAGLVLPPAVQGQSAILADGVVESTSGGFKFPDGTIQTSAADAGSPCPTMDPSDEMIEVGGVCIDRYEASIWDAPTGGNQIFGTLPCSDDGHDCGGVIFARSVAGVLPRANITWFQAQVALANSGKRLATNAEWQLAVTQTPDSTLCNTSSGALAVTGEFGSCLSFWGMFDMVGNLWEWVADWVPASTFDCPGWGAFSDDGMCLAGASTTTEGPGALIRGGSYVDGTAAGPLAVTGTTQPFFAISNIGFRGAR